MPFLSAQPLTDDPKGLSRLKAVIATDPGYETRAQHAADAVFAPATSHLAAAGPEQGPSCGTVSGSSLETPDTTSANGPSERVTSLVDRGVTAAGAVVAGLLSLALPARDGTTAIL